MPAERYGVTVTILCTTCVVTGGDIFRREMSYKRSVRGMKMIRSRVSETSCINPEIVKDESEVAQEKKAEYVP